MSAYLRDCCGDEDGLIIEPGAAVTRARSVALVRAVVPVPPPDDALVERLVRQVVVLALHVLQVIVTVRRWYTCQSIMLPVLVDGFSCDIEHMAFGRMDPNTTMHWLLSSIVDNS